MSAEPALPPDVEAAVQNLEEVGLGADREFLAQVCAAVPIDEAPAQEPPTLAGADLLDDPDAALAGFKATGGVDESMVADYLSGESLLHLLRTGSQPTMVRATMKAMVPALARQMCIEAGVEGIAAMMVAEQAAEARVDEAYHRALAGTALDDMAIPKADRLNKMADRFSRRLLKATEQLFRMRRPSVNVRIARASNVNLGTQQVVNESDDTSPDVHPAGQVESPR